MRHDKCVVCGTNGCTNQVCIDKTNGTGMDEFKQDFYKLLNDHLMKNGVGIRDFHMNLYCNGVDIDEVIDTMIETMKTSK